MKPPIADLRALAAEDSSWAGAKAATLGSLAAAGIPVPDGFVATTAATRDDVGRALAVLGDAAVAVRSSAVAEDGESASFAGQFETILGARGIAEVWDAVVRVRESAISERARAYRGGDAGAMTVLVQRMVEARVSGVALTADPMSGERDVVVVTGARGLGERLVGGVSGGDEWIVRGAEAHERRRADDAVGAHLARRVADLARRVERERAAPQDIEWAADAERLWLLQARPMTALPSRVVWEPPLPGAWARSFRLGEWITDPVTPLFESWALTAIEDRMHAIYAELIGVRAARPLHVIVNGWYYYSLNFLPARPSQILRLLPHVLPRLATRFRRVAPAFPPIARFGVGLYEREWREDLLPRYRAAVARAHRDVDAMAIADIPVLVDELLALAGEYFASVTIVAGYAWKAQLPLAQFYRRHLVAGIGGSHLDLLSGLGAPAPAAHAVECLDWSHRTLGERGAIPADPAADERRTRLDVRRSEAETRARSALSADARSRARFDSLLAEAQRSSRVREEQLAQFTIAWPVLRRALGRLGEALAARGSIAQPDDVHYALRGELAARDLRAVVAERRRARDADARLSAPLVIGRVPKMLERMLAAADEMLRGPAEPGAIVAGVPASAGSATGIARVLRSPEDGSRLARGEILVAPATAPAWTPLFERAAAVVTDVGSAAAHSSIIAREYGIPAVVGCGDATARIRDGDVVTVDGSRGVVRPARA